MTLGALLEHIVHITYDVVTHHTPCGYILRLSLSSHDNWGTPVIYHIHYAMCLQIKHVFPPPPPPHPPSSFKREGGGGGVHIGTSLFGSFQKSEFSHELEKFHLCPCNVYNDHIPVQHQHFGGGGGGVTLECLQTQPHTHTHTHTRTHACTCIHANTHTHTLVAAIRYCKMRDTQIGSTQSSPHFGVGSYPVGGLTVIVTLLDPSPQPDTLDWVMPVLTAGKTETHTSVALREICVYTPLTSSCSGVPSSTEKCHTLETLPSLQ